MLLLEVGLTGYSSWQITDDSGSDARNASVRDQVHAVGGQLGLTYVPWFASLNMHYFGEFAAQDRFQGQVFGVSVEEVLATPHTRAEKEIDMKSQRKSKYRSTEKGIHNRTLPA